MLKETTTLQHTPPAYQQIEDDLRSKIETGELLEGSMLPSRRMLAEQYHVSGPTVERAIAKLLTEGILRTHRRHGTFVAAAASQGVVRPSTPRPIQAATVGIISAARPVFGWSIKNQWTDIMTSALERTVTASGGMTHFFELRGDGESYSSVANAIDVLQSEGVDALAVVFGDRSQKNEEAAYTQHTTLPIVFIGNFKSRHSVLSVYYDSFDASIQATRHLLSVGCSSVMFFAPYTVDWVIERIAGAREAILLAGLPSKTLQISIGDQDVRDVLAPVLNGRFRHTIVAYKAARTFLAQHGGMPAQGIIAANDHVALGFQQAASEIGLTAGKDYALIGFDDHPDARPAGISTLQPPMHELGQEAGRLILNALGGQTMLQQVCLHSHLIARASSQLS